MVFLFLFCSANVLTSSKSNFLVFFPHFSSFKQIYFEFVNHSLSYFKHEIYHQNKMRGNEISAAKENYKINLLPKTCKMWYNIGACIYDSSNNNNYNTKWKVKREKFNVLPSPFFFCYSCHCCCCCSRFSSI